MKVFILTPEKTIYEGEALSFRVTEKNVSFQLLDHHISMIVFLKEGKIQLDKVKSKLIYYIKNGFLKVKNGIIKILIY